MSFLSVTPPAIATPEDEHLWNLIETCGYNINSYDKTNFHASSAYCPRLNVLSLKTNVNNSSNLALRFFAEIGNAIENTITQALESCNAVMAKQYRVTPLSIDPTLPFAGVVDMIVKNESGLPVILEIKTTARIEDETFYKKNKDGDFTKRYRKGVKSQGASLQHYFQAQTYAAFTGIRRCYILYVGRNVYESYGRIAQTFIPVDTSQSSLLSVMTQLYYAYECFKDDIVPEIADNITKSKDCRFCSFLNYCYDELGQTEKHPTQLKRAEESAVKFMNNTAERYKQTMLEIS